jgi:hypothetical protein
VVECYGFVFKVQGFSGSRDRKEYRPNLHKFGFDLDFLEF